MEFLSILLFVVFKRCDLNDRTSSNKDVLKILRVKNDEAMKSPLKNSEDFLVNKP